MQQNDTGMSATDCCSLLEQAVTGMIEQQYWWKLLASDKSELMISVLKQPWWTCCVRAVGNCVDFSRAADVICGHEFSWAKTEKNYNGKHFVFNMEKQTHQCSVKILKTSYFQSIIAAAVWWRQLCIRPDISADTDCGHHSCYRGRYIILFRPDGIIM